MPGLSRLILADADDQTRAAVRFAFEREGVQVAVAESSDRLGALVSDEPQLLIVGERVAEEPGTKVLAALRKDVVAVPAMFIGEGTSRADALRAGATSFLARPAFARDVVTMGRLLAGRKDQPGPQTYFCELGELFGLYYVVRALASARWRGVLTLVRGLRRGELRLYDGEVTSAHVGVLHGLSALHQLLLWSTARMELRVEDVVRRRQIPLEPPELLADAERFLSEIRRAGGGLSPSSVYEQDRRIDQLPELVMPIARLFDANRTLADVLEDSPFRVLETLAAAARLAEIGAIRQVSGAAEPRRSGARAALALEEWLIGQQPAVPAVFTRADSSPVGPAPGEPASPPRGGEDRRKGKKRKRRRSNGQRAMPAATPAAAAAATRAATAAAAATSQGGLPSTDWAAILPSAMSGELPGYAAVVPSVNTAGEIVGGARAPSEGVELKVDRERLEDVTDAAMRAQMFGAGEEAAVDKPQHIHEVDTAKLKRELEADADADGDADAERGNATGSVAGELVTKSGPVGAVEQGERIVVAESVSLAEAETEILARVDPAEVAAEVPQAEPVAEPPPQPSPASMAPPPHSLPRDRGRGTKGSKSIGGGGTDVEATAAMAEAEPVGPAPAQQPPPTVRPERSDPGASPGHAVEGPAASFSDAEEQFFREGLELANTMGGEVTESFEDLESGRHRTFWQRLIARPDDD